MRRIEAAAGCRSAWNFVPERYDLDESLLFLGTGYQIDVARYAFLVPELLGRIRRVNGYPVLAVGLDYSVPGLHFLGAPAAWSFGPIMRFVSGTWYSGAALKRRIAGRRAPRSPVAASADVAAVAARR